MQVPMCSGICKFNIQLTKQKNENLFYTFIMVKTFRFVKDKYSEKNRHSLSHRKRFVKNTTYIQ